MAYLKTGILGLLQEGKFQAADYGGGAQADQLKVDLTALAF